MAANATANSTFVWNHDVTSSDVRNLSGITISNSILMAISALVVALQRFYVRTKHAKSIDRWVYNFGWFMPASAMLFTAACGLNAAAAFRQLDSLDYNVPVGSSFNKMLTIGTVLYFLTAGLVKLSIYSHFNPVHTWAKLLLNWLMILFPIFCMVIVGFTVLPCGARATNNAQGVCQPAALLNQIDTIWAFVNFAINIIMVGYAIYEVVVALETRLIKACASIIVLIGVIGAAASAARAFLLFNDDPLSQVPLVMSYQKLLLSICATLEIGMLISAGCLISLRPLAARWLGESTSSFHAMTPRPGTATPLYRPDTAQTARSGMSGMGTKPLIMAQRVVVEEYPTDPVERRRKRLGLYVSAQQLEEGLGGQNAPLA